MSKEIKAAITIGLIALAVSIAAVFIFNIFYDSPFFKMPMNMVILLLIPYSLSVTGLTLYTKAKNNGDSTIIGMVCNMIALIISNLLIINAIILFFSKQN